MANIFNKKVIVLSEDRGKRGDQSVHQRIIRLWGQGSEPFGHPVLSEKLIGAGQCCDRDRGVRMALVCISGVKECCGCMRCKEEETAPCPICGEEEPDLLLPQCRRGIRGMQRVR